MTRPSAARTAGGERSKSARTRERILDAAAQVLGRHGYAGTRLSEIAELAQVQAPALYHYFSSRDDLIEHVVMTGQQATVDHVSARLAALGPDSPPLDRIETAVAAHLEVVLARSECSAAAIRNAGQLPADIRERQLVAQRAYADLWRDLIERAVAAGDVGPGLDPRAARMLILGALNWAAQWWNPDSGPLEAVIATSQAIVRRGLGGRPPAAVPAQATRRR